MPACSSFSAVFSNAFSGNVFLEAPVNTSAPLGSNATFSCAVTQAEIRWRLNKINLPLDDDDRWRNFENIGMFRGVEFSNSTVNASILIVTASPKINRTYSIACSAFRGYDHPLNNSQEVFLTVFGKLHACIE